MLAHSVRARMEQFVDDGLASLAMVSLAFANAKDPSADTVETENFNAATDRVSAALRGIRHELEEK